MSIREEALRYHSSGRKGKLQVIPTKSLLTQRDLSLAYTPGVAEPCREIAKNPASAYQYTAKGNLVGVVSNGTAVLGLGNIGPLAGRPVMEGKANLFKRFADIDCFDIEIDADDVESVIQAVRAIAPTFGGINLEDIRAPDCFEIERRLEEILDIPVFHDDQHGTAIIAGAAITNASELRGSELSSMKILFAGAGAAALATANMLVELGVKSQNIWMFDVHGLVYEGRSVDMFPEKDVYAQPAEYKDLKLKDAFVGADVFIGLSVGGIVSGEMLQRMNPQPVIFAMANPVPEITYEEAKKAVPNAIIATGRSDYPNQVNNVLGFPFVFRGALDCRARSFTSEMKRAAVQALADLAKEDVPDSVLIAYNTQRIQFGPDYLIPKPFDPRVLLWVAPAVAKAAEDSGVARNPIRDLDAYLQGLERLLEKTKEVIRPLMNRAKTSPKRIVFPDGADEKTLRAAHQLVDEGICHPVILGGANRIQRLAESLNISLRGVEIIEPWSDQRFSSFAMQLWSQRNRKGMTKRAAREFLKDSTAFGCMMVQSGFADGLLGGVAVPYADTIRPALKVLGRDPKAKVISGVYALLFEGKRMFFGDCTVNIHPDADTLAQIAINTARIAQTFGEEPRIAMLSYSDFGENRQDPQVEKVRKAIRIVQKIAPDLHIDGEMQADTAVNPRLAKADFPFSQIAGNANVLIFPDLASGNIAYKLLQELGNATAIGPIIVGFSHPVNALSLGCSVAEIVNMAAITVNQVLDFEG
ncbi:MAG: phosphate acetyltransferase [Myxococcota bacterium]|nr:phosphate acetyltransferase [Myxococcota bacterium]